MHVYRNCVLLLFCLTITACGGGGGNVKPTPVPTKTCSERLGTGVFVTSTITNPSVTDTTCPSGQTLTQSGISNTTTTTTYSCPTPASFTDPVASSSTSAPVSTQTKICTTPVALTCAQKLGTGAFVNTTQTSTVSDNTCPIGQQVVQDGLSEITTITTYSCLIPSSTDNPIASVVVTSPKLTKPKMCNLVAPINYSTYFLEKTNVPQAHAAGFTGSNVKIVIYDEGFNVNNPALFGRISKTFGTITDDDVSHGTSTATIASGFAVGILPGGVAPNSVLAISDWNASIQPIINWGAQVYNFSFGYDPESAGASQADINKYLVPWVPDLRAIKNSGAFIAISAGNESLDSAQILAGATAFYPDITNILAVVAMSPLNGVLAGYSNKCGDIAKDFCIAAPGTVNLLKPSVNQGDLLNDSSYEWFAGTSAAAPIVSGIAALVYQAFPGFSGTQVRDTLISTATDIGELGNDAIYGVGLVNAEKAVLGPAKLSLSFMAAVPNNVVWNFANDIEGEGGIIKSGDGSLSLWGNNTYLGGTEVQSGQLNLFGNVTGEVFLNGGSLFATGDVFGNVQANSGTLLLSSQDAFQVHGELNLGGSSLQLKLPEGYINQWQGSLVFANQINGVAELTAPSAWFTADANIGGQEITASLQRKSVVDVLPSVNSTENNTASNLEIAFLQLDLGNGSEVLKKSAASLQSTNMTEAKIAFNTLAGQSQTTSQDIALETADALQPLFTERLYDVAQLPESKGGFWMMFANPNASKKAAGFLSVDVDSNIIAVGADYRWSDVIFGAAIFKADDRARFDDVRDNIEGDRTGAALYARHQGEYGFLQGFVYWTQFDLNTFRTLQIANESTVATSRSNGSSSGLSLEYGKTFASNITLALQASTDWVDTDAFSETGLTGFELQFNKDSLMRTLLGPDIRYQHEYESGFLWNAQIGYRYVLNDVNTDMQAAYAGLPDNYFTVLGMPYSDDFLNWSLGLGYQTNKTLWYLRNDGQNADNAKRSTWSAGLRISF